MDDFQVNPSAPGPTPGPEVEDEGSRLTGVLGALLGAAVGAVPWFLATAFSDYYVGWLGFAIGWASAFGYRKLRGRRSFPFAMACVALCSLLALTAANLGALLLVLCMDPEWRESAAWAGMSVTRLAAVSLLMRENRQYVLSAMGGGLVVGGIGMLTAGTYVRRYTNPELAAEVERQAREAAYHSTGLELPVRFTVRPGRVEAVLGAVSTALFAGFAVFFLIFDSHWIILGFVPFLLLGLYVLLAAVNTRLEVDGNHLRAKNTLGRITEFEAGDIDGISMGYGRAVVFRGQGGRKLFRMEPGMKNAPLMMQWLKEHDIPLRG